MRSRREYQHADYGQHCRDELFGYIRETIIVAGRTELELLSGNAPIKGAFFFDLLISVETSIKSQVRVMAPPLFRTRSRAAKEPPRYAIPDGVRVYAIGDVHGCLDEMTRVLQEVRRDLATREIRSQIVFLGDLIDRGPNSAGVIQKLLDDPLPGDEVSFLMGNHEEAMLACYDGDVRSYGPWLQNGGVKTLTSYGLSEAAIFRRSFDLSEAMRIAIPPEHVTFVRSFKEQLRIGDYLFVHAGIRPGVPLEAQTGRDLRWIRTGFLDSREDHGFVVVHGHTIVPQVQKKSNRIAVDTGCYMTGQLSVVALEGSKVEVLSTPARDTV